MRYERVSGGSGLRSCDWARDAELSEAGGEVAAAPVGRSTKMASDTIPDGLVVTLLHRCCILHNKALFISTSTVRHPLFELRVGPLIERNLGA